MVHEVADDDGTLTARTDIDAAMAGRVARRRGEPKRVVKLKLIVDQQRLTSRDHRLTVKPPDVSGWIVSALSRFLPGGVLELVKHVFCLRESRDPPPVAEQSIPAAVVDVQVCAEYVVDILEPQPAGAETVQPGLLWKVHRWRVALVLPSTGIHQNGTLGGTHYEGLISDHHAPRGNIEYKWIELWDSRLPTSGSYAGNMSSGRRQGPSRSMMLVIVTSPILSVCILPDLHGGTISRF